MANRVLLGLLSANDWRLRISAPGHNVLDTGLTKNQLYFDSTWPKTMNVFMKGTFTFPRQNKNTTYTAVSWPDLGYIPSCLCYALGYHGPASHSTYVLAPRITSTGIVLHYEDDYFANVDLFQIWYVVFYGAEGEM